MGQERKGEYNASLTSVAEDKFRQGLLPPGRYKGFDTMTNAGGTGVNINITHTGKGFIRNTFANPPAAESNPFAYIVTPQGVAVETDVAASSISITATTGGNGYRRVDAIVFEHEYTQVQGGAVGNVITITGTETDGSTTSSEYPAKPGLSNSSKQTLLGYLFIKESSTFSYSDLKYVPVDSPDLASEEVTRGNKINVQSSLWAKEEAKNPTIVSDTLNIDNLAPVVYYDDGGNHSLKWIRCNDLGETGLTDFPDGLEIKFHVSNNTTVYLGANNAPAATSSTYPFQTLKMLKHPGGGQSRGSTNGMEPTVNNIRDGWFTLRFNKSENLFYIHDTISNVGNRITDYESGWFYTTSGVTQTTTWGTGFTSKLRYKTYFSNSSTSYSGAALNYRANTASVCLAMNYTGNSTAGVSSIVYNLTANLDEFIDSSSNYFEVIGHVIYDDVAANNSIVTGTLSGGQFTVKRLDRANFQTDNEIIQFYFNFTIPITNS